MERAKTFNPGEVVVEFVGGYISGISRWNSKAAYPELCLDAVLGIFFFEVG